MPGVLVEHARDPASPGGAHRPPHRRATMKRVRAAALSAAAVVPLALGLPGAAATPSDDDRHRNGTNEESATEADFTRSVLTTGLSDPFEIIWGPDDQLWVTERTA